MECFHCIDRFTVMSNPGNPAYIKWVKFFKDGILAEEFFWDVVDSQGYSPVLHDPVLENVKGLRDLILGHVHPSRLAVHIDLV
jgi:hypothetical protein